jgi:hypothetical protein
MIITYRNGTSVEGCILLRGDNWLRAAIKGSEGVVVLTCVNGTWISDDSAPVEVVFEWQRRSRKEAISESDCVCSKELAARLIHLLLIGAENHPGLNDLSDLPIHGRNLAGPVAIQSVN